MLQHILPALLGRGTLACAAAGSPLGRTLTTTYIRTQHMEACSVVASMTGPGTSSSEGSIGLWKLQSSQPVCSIEVSPVTAAELARTHACSMQSLSSQTPHASTSSRANSLHDHRAAHQPSAVLLPSPSTSCATLVRAGSWAFSALRYGVRSPQGLGHVHSAQRYGQRVSLEPIGQLRHCSKLPAGQLSRVRVPKSAAINDVIMPNTTQLKYGLYGIRAITGKRVAANTIEAVRRAVRRKVKKTARLWVHIAATVPVTKKPLGIRMGKGKGVIDYYATAVRPGQIIFEMDRVPRAVALQALEAAQHKFPCKLGLVEWS